MKSKETGRDKVKKICEILREETLEPAKVEADSIVEEAKKQAEAIVKEGRRAATALIQDAEQDIARQKNIFQSSLNQASKQTVETLKQTIEDKIFNQELGRLVTEETRNPKVIANIVNAIVKAIEKEGIDTDLSAVIPSTVPAEEVNSFLASEVLKKLREKSVLLGPIAGGAQVKMHDGNITLDISDKAIKELVASYARKDFRDLIFQST